MRNSLTLAGLLLFAYAPAAQAGEACRPAKDMIRVVNAFYGADADRVDIINPSVSLKMTGINGHPTPTQMLIRHEGQNLYLDINEDGFVQDIDKVATLSKDSEICRIIDGELAPETEGASTSVNVTFNFFFRRQDGDFSIDEILEGTKDGSKVMNGVAPGGLGFAVPGLKAIILKPTDTGGTLPSAQFMRKGETVSVPVSAYDESQFIRLKDIKSSKANRMVITGDYILDAGFKFDPDEIAEAEAKRLAALAQQPAE